MNGKRGSSLFSNMTGKAVRTGILKIQKKMLLLLITAAVCLGACSCSSDGNSESADILTSAEEISFNTVKAEIGTVGTTYYAEGAFRSPYVEVVKVPQDGVVKKLFTGDEIQKGELICEIMIEGLDEEYETQKLIAEAAEQSYNNIKSSSASKNDLEYAQIIYEQEKLKLDRIIEKMADTKIYAPCSGKVSRRKDSSVRAGDYVREGTFLCEISNDEQRTLTAFVYGESLQNVNFGSRVKVRQGNVVNFESTVTDIVFLDGGTDYSGYFYLIDVPEGTEFLDFTTIDIIFDINTKDNVVYIPPKALNKVGDRYYVNALIDGAKVEIDVEIGIESDDKTEIVSGLDGGEELIVSGSASSDTISFEITV